MDMPAIKWHMIGHLQRNKVKPAVKLFDLIHSVDRFELLKDINKEAANLGKIQSVLIQVKLADEKTKLGLHPDKLLPLLEASEELETGSAGATSNCGKPRSARRGFKLTKSLKQLRSRD